MDVGVTPVAERDPDAAWGEPARSEAAWPARLAVLAAVALYLILPDGLTLGIALKWGVTIVEVALLIPLTVAPRAARGRARRPAPPPPRDSGCARRRSR